MSQAHYTGGCRCGAVRFESRAEPYRVGICHCLDCRKHSGSFFNTFAIFPTEAVTIAGEVGTYRGRSFCRNSGSPVFGRSADWRSMSRPQRRSSLSTPEDRRRSAPDLAGWLRRRR